MKPYIIGFYGDSNSGKTTLVVDIIKKLTDKGFNVASVKITNKDISIDTKNKDTWKHGSAGAKIVVFSTKKETDFLIKQKMTNSEIVNILDKFGNYAIVIIEGSNDDNIPKIRLGRIQERANTIYTYDNDFEKLINKILENIQGRN